jgi:hypothetical protein
MTISYRVALTGTGTREAASSSDRGTEHTMALFRRPGEEKGPPEIWHYSRARVSLADRYFLSSISYML